MIKCTAECIYGKLKYTLIYIQTCVLCIYFQLNICNDEVAI